MRTSLIEQKVLGGFDPEAFSDAVRGRLTHAMRERLTDSIRERLHDAYRDRLRETIQSAVIQARPASEFTGFGTGMH